MFSYQGDLVLDPFLGSGTTVKVARELSREAVGYERELQYKQTIMDKLGIGTQGSSSPIVEAMAKRFGEFKEPQKMKDADEIVMTRSDVDNMEMVFGASDDYKDDSQAA